MITLIDAAHALAAGRVTPRDLTEACLAKAQDPAGESQRVFTDLQADAARATADAQHHLRKAGQAGSPFAGIPITIKDLFDVAGQVTRAGSRVLATSAPAVTTAPAIARLLGAGFVIIGRTNMTEFAFSGLGLNPHYPTPTTPYDRANRHIPGGSSSGAAVSVADGMALGAIGTDTGGSCRIPAACCGITGFKPTAARIPLSGAIPLSPTLDSIGPLAQTVADCEALANIMAAAPLTPAQPRTLGGVRLLLAQNIVLDGIDIPTETSFDRAIRRLAAHGVSFAATECKSFASVMHANRKGGFAAAEAYAWHRDYLEKSSDLYDPRVAARIKGGAQMLAADYAQTQWDRARIIAEFAQEMEGFDAVIMPTIPVQPPKIADLQDDEAYRRINFLLLRNPSLINFLDGCAISLPCHEAAAPPAGLMLAAPRMQDHKLLAIAKSIESALRE